MGLLHIDVKLMQHKQPVWKWIEFYVWIWTIRTRFYTWTKGLDSDAQWKTQESACNWSQNESIFIQEFKAIVLNLAWIDIYLCKLINQIAHNLMNWDKNHFRRNSVIKNKQSFLFLKCRWMRFRGHYFEGLKILEIFWLLDECGFSLFSYYRYFFLIFQSKSSSSSARFPQRLNRGRGLKG